MEVVKHEDQIFPIYKGKFYDYFYCCHKFGHKVADCTTKGKNKSLRRKQNTNTEYDKGQVRRIPHGKMWKKNSDYKDSEETQISNINDQVSKDDDEHNSAIDKNDSYYEENQDGDVKEYTDENEDEYDEKGHSDYCGILF